MADQQMKSKLGAYARKAWQAIRWFFRRFQVIRWLIFLGLLTILLFSTYFTYKAKTADVQAIQSKMQTKTTLYDEQNQAAGSLYGQKGTYVSLPNIATSVQNAVIATEDRTFYTNPGFSIKGMARAFISLIVHRGQISGGGSTITQQLAKNTLLSQKQSFFRKAQELFLAVQLTKVYSKADILTMYLNNAHFGNGVWGVEDASRRYFGKNASQLTNSEGATLAAMLRNPSFYNPVDHMDNAVARRNLVLGLMQTTGKISQQEVDAAKQSQLVLADTYTESHEQKYPYFLDAVIEEAYQKYDIEDDDLVNSGYKVYTTLNPTYQVQMQQTFAQDWLFPQNAADGTQAQAGTVVMDPTTGAVQAVVGSRGQHVYLGYNYATQLKRSPGSTIKPLMVYTPALEAGYSYDSELTDKKLSYGKNHYTPTNPTGQYLGQVPMYTALAQSLNAPAVWLMNQLGVNKGVASLARFGIDLKQSDQNLASVLGGVTTGFSPLTMAQAYAAFANGGSLPQAHFIRKIVDATGKVVVDNEKPSLKRIMKPEVAKEMTSMMIGTFKNGTAAGVAPFGYTVAGKTGSTEVPDAWGYGTRDQWLVGYTPDLVVATWTGFAQTDAQHFLRGTSESGVATVFKQQLTSLLPATAQTPFDTQDAQQRATIQTPGVNGDIWGDVESKIKKGVDKAKDTLNQWYNGLKDFFD